MSDGKSTLITGIGELTTNDGEPDGDKPGAFAAMSNAALVIAEGKVAWTGPAARAPAADAVVDAAGRAVLPGFADSHAHLIFAGERSAEFAARMAGDASPALDATQVRRIAAELADLGVFWLEEPLPGGDLDGMRALRRHVRVAGGEMARTPAELLAALEAGALDVLQPDAVLAVGIDTDRLGEEEVAALLGPAGRVIGELYVGAAAQAGHHVQVGQQAEAVGPGVRGEPAVP